jgi:hypothetical protein
LASQHIYFYLKTQDFTYSGDDIRSDRSFTTPSEILNEIRKRFDMVFKKNTLYRSTGVVLRALRPKNYFYRDLFGEFKQHDRIREIYDTVDTLNQKYRKDAVFLASSLRVNHTAKKCSADYTRKNLHILTIPYIGTVS